MAIVPTEALLAYDMRPPVDGLADPLDVQRLAGTGATGAENSTALTAGQMATILVGAAAIRIRWGATAPEADTTDPILPAYGRFDWRVSTQDCFISIQAADGTSAYEAHVWTSSGQRSATSG